MQVILLEDIAKLGALGDQVVVKPGYGRNSLMPYGKAVPATEANIAEFEQRRAELEAAAAQQLEEARARGEKLAAIGPLTVSANASDEGRLFGSVGPREIADLIAEAGLEVAASEIVLSEPLREVGEFEVEIHLHAEVVQPVTLTITAE